MTRLLMRTTHEDRRLIGRIANRAMAIAARQGIGNHYTQPDLEHDLTICHLNGCPLDLQRLSRADDEHVAHDVFGISKFLHFRSGELQGGFWPRHAARTLVSQG